ncbi:pyridoxamine 5'-phosphate oxidase family protein [Pseudonocardia ailaonensis]
MAITAIDPGRILEYLQGCRSLQLATLGPDGWPHQATMWFGVLDGDPVMWTQKTSVKARNIRHDPRVSCLAESGRAYDELRGVSARGRAELVEDPDELVRIGAVVIPRYWEEPLPDSRAMALSGARVGIRIHVEHWASWDFSTAGAADRKRS